MSDNIIQLNEAAIKGELKDLVKNSVKENLNALLDHESDELVNAERYERSGDRKVLRKGGFITPVFPRYGQKDTLLFKTQQLFDYDR